MLISMNVRLYVWKKISRYLRKYECVCMCWCSVDEHDRKTLHPAKYGNAQKDIYMHDLYICIYIYYIPIYLYTYVHKPYIHKWVHSRVCRLSFCTLHERSLRSSAERAQFILSLTAILVLPLLNSCCLCICVGGFRVFFIHFRLDFRLVKT